LVKNGLEKQIVKQINFLHTKSLLYDYEYKFIRGFLSELDRCWSDPVEICPIVFWYHPTHGQTSRC